MRLDLNGVPTSILDTAGLRDRAGTIEEEGIRRSIEAAQHANIVVLVADASSSHWQKDVADISGRTGRVDLLVLNKIDHGVPAVAPADAMLISAQDDEDIVKLIKRLGAGLRRRRAPRRPHHRDAGREVRWRGSPVRGPRAPCRHRDCSRGGP